MKCTANEFDRFIRTLIPDFPDHVTKVVITAEVGSVVAIEITRFANLPEQTKETNQYTLIELPDLKTRKFTKDQTAAVVGKC